MLIFILIAIKYIANGLAIYLESYHFRAHLVPHLTATYEADTISSVEVGWLNGWLAGGMVALPLCSALNNYVSQAGSEPVWHTPLSIRHGHPPCTLPSELPS